MNNFVHHPLSYPHLNIEEHIKHLLLTTNLILQISILDCPRLNNVVIWLNT